MFDLKLLYRNGTTEIAGLDIPTLEDAEAARNFYLSYTTPGHPYEVISCKIISM